jgi:hypothetical protein
MIRKGDSNYFCPLFGHDIAEGKCLDINYERLGYLSDGCLDEVTLITGKKEPEITSVCESCPNLPFGKVLGTVVFPGDNKGGPKAKGT